MWPRSARLDATLAQSHTVAARVDVLFDGEVIARVGDGGNVGVSARVGLVAGAVQVDRSTVRRRGDVTFHDPANELREVIRPLRGELRLWRGAVYHDATYAEQRDGTDRELLPVATLVVTKPLGGDWPQVAVAGADRLWYVARQRFPRPWKVTPNVPIAREGMAILSARLEPGRRAFDVPDTGASTGGGSQVFDEQADPAEAAADLFVAAGQRLYADPMGTMTARSEPEPDAQDAVLTLAPGPSSVMLRPARERDASNAENAVVATGEAPDLAAPVWGYAVDDNPRSLTYVPSLNSPGVIPRFYSSPQLRTNEQCTQAARTILRTQLGISDTIAQGMVPHPGWEAGDVLRILDPDQDLDVAVVLDSFTVPLTADGPMELACRTAAVRL